MNGGQIITQILHDWGIENLFTLSGGHIAPIYVEAEKSGIRIIDVRHEATAVFAADAMARMSGVPGVAVVTAGPGVTNTITALKNAQMAESPVLLIGGAAATLLKDRGALQDIDQLSIVRSMVKFSARINRRKEIQPIIEKALKEAVNGFPGPVFVEVPMDLLYDEQMVRELYDSQLSRSTSFQARLVNWYIKRHVNRLFGGATYSKKGLSGYRTVYPNASESVVQQVGQKMLAAERPVLLLGSGATKNTKKVDALSKAVEKLNIPVYLSGMSRGLLGPKSAAQLYHKRTKALKESDCVILAGVPCDFRLNYGNHFRRSATKIAISLNRTDLEKNLKASQKIQADPADFFIRLSETLKYKKGKWSVWKETLQKREAGRETEIKKTGEQHTEFTNPIALLQSLEALLPEKSVIVVDGGDFAASAAYVLKPRGPLKWLDPGVFGTLGSGGGFALGAALTYPDHYIWIIYGDGSAAYSLMEFDTFRKFGLKVCGIIGNNGSWEQIARDQVHILGRDTASSLPRSDYEKVVMAFGAGGEKVENLDIFNTSVQRAIQSMDNGRPYLVNALIGSTDFRKGSMSM